MNNFTCEITGCTKQYTSKYALEKHQRNNYLSDSSDTTLPGKRKRGTASLSPCGGEDNNNNETFSGLCVCGILMRDKWTLDRHISKCPVVVPIKETLESINYKTLRVPTNSELAQLE